MNELLDLVLAEKSVLDSERIKRTSIRLTHFYKLFNMNNEKM